MSQTIETTTVFRVPAAELFSIYTDSVKHSAALGSRVEISSEAGVAFTVFDGAVRGRNLLVEPKTRIVQTWRGSVWAEEDPDSLVILVFEDTIAGGAIHLTHTGIPDHSYPHIDWERAYWQPWRRYLELCLELSTVADNDEERTTR